MRTDPSREPWSRFRTGAFLLVGLAAAAAVVFFLDEVLRELAEGPELIVVAREARDLRPGAEVWVGGVPAGRVLTVRFREPAADGAGRVVVRAVLHEDAAGQLRADASALVRESALLAPSVVAVHPGDADAPFDFADTLRAEQRAGSADVLARADSLRRRLDALRPLAERLRARMEEGPGTLAALRRDDALAAELADGAARMRRWADSAEGGTAALVGRDSALVARWERIAARGDTLKRVLPSGEIAELDAVLTGLERRIGALETGLSEGHGTAGRLLTDGALARERRTLEARLDSVKAELLADPLRWLRIRLF